MLRNVIVAFIIPFIFIIILYFKDKKILLTIAPCQSAIAYTINSIGFNFGLWDLYPFGQKGIVHVPFDIGIYPALSAWMIYFINCKKVTPSKAILIFAILTTGFEGYGILLGRVVYGHGWNIGWTFISYLVPYIINYRYYLSLKGIGVF
jgi:hypothetical protein